MSRLEFIQDEYYKTNKIERKKNINVQKFLNRLKTFEEKSVFLNMIETKKEG